VLHNLRNTLRIAFPLLLFVLFLATAIAASKGIAPVKKLIKAASGISGIHINDARLPLPENQGRNSPIGGTTINELLQRVESSVFNAKNSSPPTPRTKYARHLTAIRGTLEVLLRKKREPAQYEEKINRVIGEVDRLHGMLDQLLQLARLESGHVACPSERRLTCMMLFRTLSDKWQPRLQEKNIALQPANTACDKC
jgi:signal transduction histidine kinase